MKNTLREKMLKGEKTFGSFQVLGNETLVELMAYAGFDYVLLDTEHGPYDVEKAQALIRAAKLTGITPLVRTKDSERNSILKMLDVGAMGLVIPHVNSVAQVREIVEYGKYAPMGDRGFGLTNGNTFLTADYATQGLDHYFEVKNRETLLIPQCETKECLENIEEIVQIDGVDGIFVGPYDLSVALGIPGETNGDVMQAAVDRVLAACQKAGKFAFIYTGNIADAKTKFDLGYNSVTFSMDAEIFLKACQNTVKDVKE